MADEIATMVARLDADMTRFEKNINKALGIANTRANAIEKRFQSMNSKIGAIDFGGAMSKAFGIFTGSVALNKLREFSDGFIRIQNNLKVAGLTGDSLNATMQQLYEIAQRTGTPLEGLSELFGRVSQAQKTLNASSQDVIGLTSIVATALQVSGKSASESAGAMLQLGQALSGGKVQAEEYNSLLDGMYPLLQAAAAGMKEAGGDVSALTRLVKDGKVSSEAFFRAIQAGASVLDQKLVGATATSSQGLTKFGNDLTLAAGKLEEAFGATQKFNDVLSATGGFANTAAVKILDLTTALDTYAKSRIAAAEADVAAAAKSSPSLASLLEKTRPDLAPYKTGGTMDTYTPTIEGREEERAAALARLPKPVAPIQPISLADYKVPGTDKKTGAKTLNEYERENKAIEEKIALLNAEKKAVGGSAVEVEKAKTAQELLNAAKAAEIEVTPKLAAEIDRQATAYATLKVAVDEAKAAQERLKQANEAFISGTADLAGTFAVDFKNGVLEGASAMDALRTAGANALTTLSDMLIKLGMQMLVLTAFQSMGFRVSPGMFPTLPFGFGGTRAGGGSVQPGRSFMVGEHGPERFVPTTPGAIVPKAAGGAITIVGPTINAPNSDAVALARLRSDVVAEMQTMRRDLPKIIASHRSHGRLS